MRGWWFTGRMDEKTLARIAAGSARRARDTLREDIDSLRLDAGLSVSALARSAGVEAGFLRRILRGDVRPSIETYARLTAALGADLATRVYPNTGPLVRDRHQAPMVELVLAARDPRWHPFLEAAVRRPSRGWIDLVLHEPRENVVIATEVQSALHRLEQLIRWHGAKADSLPSWDAWDRLGQEEPRISRLLLIRRTRSTTAAAHEFAQQLRLAYPAHPDDALASLTGRSPWPGPAIVWVVIDGRGVRFTSGR